MTDEHLGGYTPGGDAATWYPELWDWLVAEQEIGSVLDVGCGEGHALNHFIGLGCAVIGVDGLAQEHPRIVQHDFTTGTWEPLLGKLAGPWRVDGFDLVWSCEFVEHVEERYLPNVLDAFRLAPLVLMTHAFPDQLGHHHVNCRRPDYWIGTLAAIGYVVDEALTERTREVAAANPDPLNHYVRSGLAFRRLP